MRGPGGGLFCPKDPERMSLKNGHKSNLPRRKDVEEVNDKKEALGRKK